MVPKQDASTWTTDSLPWNSNGQAKKEKEALEDNEDKRKILVPDDADEQIGKFTFKKLWIFLGPGFLMSLAYLDPGNIESDLQAGGVAGYKLLWVLLTAHILGLLLQRLSARFGVVSGKHMAEVAYYYYPKIPRIILWIMVEFAIIGSDIQEVIGTSLAIYLLSNARIPIWIGVLITVVDTFTFLLLDRYGYRKLEAFFVTCIAVMAASFGYEYFIVKPPHNEVLKGAFIPYCFDKCNRAVFMQAVGCIGAVIMPHNIYLHSALVQSRKINRKKKAAIEEANKYFFIESALALVCSFIINLFVMSVFGTGINDVTNQEMHDQCINTNNPHWNVFPNNTEPLDIDIYTGGVYLGCRFGIAAMYIWAIGMLAAGQSSTMAGCYAGQFVMEGFIQLKWSRWKRLLFTRSIAIIPALTVAAISDVKNLSHMNDMLNALMMIQLPFALIPLLTFASSKRIMHSFRAAMIYRSFFALVSCLIISINIYFMFTYVTERFEHTWLLTGILGGFFTFYFGFVFYLIYYCAASIGSDALLKADCAKNMFPLGDYLGTDAPWLEYEKEEKSLTEKIKF